MWTTFKALSIGTKLGVIGGVLLLLSVLMGSAYYIGYNKGETISQVQILTYENKLKDLNTRLAQAQGRVDVQVVTEYKDRVAYVDRVVYRTRDVVRDNVVEQFNLSKGWIYAYNQSVRGLPVDAALAADATPSTTSEMIALADTIIPNNGICLSNRAKLDALQNWITQTGETANAN